MDDSAPTMTAVAIDRFGPPQVLVARELPRPQPGPGQARIDVAFAGITFIETQIRAGNVPRREMLPQLPAVLGNGVGGAVGAVGDGADPGLVGRRVIAGLNGTGGYAQAALADARALVAVSDGVALDDATAVLADGRTAVLVLDALGLAAGETLLVAPAGGGVGTLLVQLAASRGVRVIAAAGAADKRALAVRLGAERALDYGAPGWGADVAGGIEALVDGVGGEIGERAARLLAPGGRRVALGLAAGRFAQVAREDVETVATGMPTVAERVALVTRVLDAVSAGTLVPVIGARHPLSEAADAHAAIEARAVVGKTLLEVA